MTTRDADTVLPGRSQESRKFHVTRPSSLCGSQQIQRQDPHRLPAAHDERCRLPVAACPSSSTVRVSRTSRCPWKARALCATRVDDEALAAIRRPPRASCSMNNAMSSQRIKQRLRLLGRDHPGIRKRLLDRGLEAIEHRHPDDSRASRPPDAAGASRAPCAWSRRCATVSSTSTSSTCGRARQPRPDRHERRVVRPCSRTRSCVCRPPDRSSRMSSSWSRDVATAAPSRNAVRGRHALAERVVRVRLREDGDAAAQPVVVGPEARSMVVGEPPTFDRVLRDEVAVGERLDAQSSCAGSRERRAAACRT